MDTYAALSERFARELTLTYSSSFGIASRFFARPIRKHIFNIYGLVRIADEIVDTYRGEEQERLLNELELDVLRAVRIGYSSNPIVHAYARTAVMFGFDPSYIQAFFKSMRMDVTTFENTTKNYKTYIFGSAEVIGLLCLKVFVGGDEEQFTRLQEGARRLGSAYQKVNFLRDVASDHLALGRTYFPNVTFGSLGNNKKEAIIRDIESDFAAARVAVRQLPRSSRRAVEISFVYYRALLHKIKTTDVDILKSRRVRIPTAQKLFLIVTTTLGLTRA